MVLAKAGVNTREIQPSSYARLRQYFHVGRKATVGKTLWI